MRPALEIIVQKQRSALVCIEFQKEWLAASGTLQRLLVKDKKLFQTAVDNAAALLQTARDSGWQVAHAGLDLSCDPGYLLYNQGRKTLGLRGAIPKAGTWTGSGADFVPPFVPQNGEYIVKGRSGASVLANSTLDPFMRNNGLDTLILMGFALHVCVESSMRHAHDLGYNVIVASDACGVFEAEQKLYFEQHVAHHFGLTAPAAQLIDHMRQRA